MSSPRLPNIQQQLQQLTHTDSLVEFYRSKVASYEQQITEFDSKLEEYRLEHEQQFKTEKQLRESMDQIDDLRETLTNTNIRLFREKERNLLLKTENSALKMREASDRKKIHYLLTICGINDEEIVAIMLNSDTALRESLPCCVRRDEQDLKLSARSFDIQVKNEILQLEINSTKALLAERTELSLREREALINEQTALLRDYENRKANEAALIDDLTERLRKAQAALNDGIKSGKRWTLDKTKFELSNERQSSPKSPRASNKATKSVDPDKRLCQHHQTKNAAPNASSRNNTKNVEQKLQSLRTLCEEKDKVIAELQKELLRLRRNVDEKPEEKKQGNLAERVRILTAHNRDLERRRKLDLEGFKTDIKFLRDQIKGIERHLLKIVLNLGNKYENIDFSSLEAIEASASRSETIVVKLKDLKSRLENLRTDE